MSGTSHRNLKIVLWIVLGLAAVVALDLLSLPLAFMALPVILCGVLAPQAPMSLLVVLLTLSPLRALVATEADVSTAIDIGQILLPLYLAVWLAHRIMQRKPILRMDRDPVLFATLGLVGVFGLGAWSNTSLSAWLNEWLKWVVIALLIWQLSLTARANWRWLIFAFLISGVANALVGLYIFFGGSGADHLLILGRFFRAFGTFGQPNPFGGFMGITFPIGLAGAYSHAAFLLNNHRAGLRCKVSHLALFAAYGLATLIIFSALVASWSRGAWLGFAVAALIMVIAVPKRIIRGVSLAAGMLAMIAALWFTGLLPRSVVDRLSSSADNLFTLADVRGIPIDASNYAVIERLAHWQAAINMAGDRPILGVGLGSYEIVYDNFRLIHWEAPLGHAHNFYLNILAEAGIVGLAAFIAFWLVILALTWRLRRHPDGFARTIGIGLLGCWTYIAVHSIFDNLYVNNLFLHIGVLLGVLSILYRQLNQALELE